MSPPSGRIPRTGYYGVGVVGGKNANNLGTLWRSAFQLNAAFLCTVGTRYRAQPTDTADAHADSTPQGRRAAGPSGPQGPVHRPGPGVNGTYREPCMHLGTSGQRRLARAAVRARRYIHSKYT